MPLKRILSALYVLIFVSNINSQDKLNVNVNTFGLVSSNDQIVPHYQHSNNWGIVSPLDESNFFLQAGLSYQILNNRNISLKTGISVVGKDNIDDSFLQEIFISGKAFNFLNFSLGKEAYSPVAYDDRITVGSFLYNSNARPVPRITVGIYEYLPLGFTNDWFAIRGGISEGVLNDDRTKKEKNNSANNVLLHEKWAYGRFGKGKVQPYVGIVHSAIHGGTRPDGTKIPVDYWATFFASGSETLGGGEATNAAGAHEGFWDFGIYTDIGKHSVQAYIQKPFADGSGMNFWRFNNKDFKIGLIADVKDIKWLNKFSIEFMRTDHQSGPGTPDPYYPVAYNGHGKGHIIWDDDINDDYDRFMHEVFDQTSTGWQKDAVWEHIRNETNYGYKFGGRDDYNNNGSYYNGWTYHGQNLGNPLYHTSEMVTAYAPDYEQRDAVRFMNTRVRAVHLGLQGSIIPALDYLFKTTITNNFGSYSEEYVTRESWEEVENYYYKGGKTQVYSFLELNYMPKKLDKLQFSSSIAYDGGQLYNSFGWSLGLKYKPFN
ncbi:capsule assembly Wzi family protein [Saccharicrinis aurantiacus]|uniref:capsule assembly Wzi family protein n=1 Tax=Saccharicrinis aurantiacus TaxID=1849719 RepID=UPI00094FC457|nr:capsule assembly Wzi family protein [Saccharicrinis aurantiacus]